MLPFYLNDDPSIYTASVFWDKTKSKLENVQLKNWG